MIIVDDETGILPSRSTTGDSNIMNENPNTEAPSTTSTEVKATEAVKEISKLEPNAKLHDVIAKVNELVERTNTKRDRGPESTRNMTEDDARRIMLGDLKDVSHTKTAEMLGLSYGQVYSARKGFTYKTIAKEAEKAARAGK